MKSKYVITVDGVEVAKTDLQTLAGAANADDAVFDQLLKITPYDGSTVGKFVMPRFNFTVLPNGNGLVVVRPFAFAVGSRVTALANLSDNAFSATVGQFDQRVLPADTLGWNVSLSANGAGGPRWDLVYAKIVVNKLAVPVVRYVKDPSTKVIAPAMITVTETNDCTIQYLTGTTNVDTFPSLPADDVANSTFYIPLAFLRIPASFNPATGALGLNHIAEVMPCRATGGSNTAPAKSTRADGIDHSSWFSGGIRSPMYFATSMVGTESRFFMIDLGTTSNMLIDNTIDWSKRLFRWEVFARSAGAAPVFAWDFGSSDISVGVPPHAAQGTITGTNYLSGLGSSFTDDFPTITFGGSTPASVVMYLSNAVLSQVANNCFLYVDSTGALKFDTSGDIAAKLLIWVTASGQFGPIP